MCKALTTFGTEEELSVGVCSPDGTDVDDVACDEAQYCAEVDGGAACVDQICTPAEPLCNDNKATVCHALGSDFVADRVDCDPGVCIDGKCVDLVCAPATTSCADDHRRRRLRLAELGEQHQALVDLSPQRLQQLGPSR